MKMQSFLTFFASFLSVIGLFGGIAYAIVGGGYFIAFCIAILGITAISWHKKRWDDTLNPKY